MRVSQLIPGMAFLLATIDLPLAAPAAPVAVVAQAATPTPAEAKDAVKKALNSVDLTLRQKLQIKPMFENYKAQSANADPATKQAEQKALIKQIYGVLTPTQQAQFKASIKQSLGNAR